VNKNDLVNAVAANSGLTKADAAKAVDSVFDAIADALKGGDEVRLVGFGTFAVAERAASEGRNPRTGEKIAIAASNRSLNLEDFTSAMFSRSTKTGNVLSAIESQGFRLRRASAPG
jgi:DNA-binding protein HU-beta